MDARRIARKLQPLMPEQMDHWLRAMDTADPDLRSLLEKQIVSEAYRRLGDFRQRVLLSLPPPTKAKGEYSLGTVLYDRPKWPFGLSAGELLQNLAIFGRSGAGKTNATFHIIEQLQSSKTPFLFLDWKRTARHLLPRLPTDTNIYTPGRALRPFPFNPFLVPPGLEREVYIQHVVDVMADAYTLGDGVRSVLQKSIAACYARSTTAPLVTDIIREVDAFPDRERVRGWKISAIRALESLSFANISSGTSAAQQQLARDLLERNTIIELDALSQSSKKFLLPILCLWLYYVKLADPKRERLGLVIVVEEAHHVLYRDQGKAKETLMAMLLRQCREIGIAMMVVDQHPHLISSAALGNTYTSICLNLKDPADINRAAGISGVPDDEKWCFTQLPVGQAVVKLQDRWRHPVLVQFPLVPVNKGSITDDQLRRGDSQGTGRQWPPPAGFAPDERVPVTDTILQPWDFAFLEDVLSFPHDGVKRRYQRLGLSVRRGMAIRDRLLSAGYLEGEVIKVGASRRVLLRLRRRAREMLGTAKAASDDSRESLAHAFWKAYHAEQFRNAGYAVMVEAPRRGGRVDVLAVKGAERVGIEVETGKSDVVSNVRNCLATKFDRVIVVATNEQAMRKVEQALAQDGLLVPGRVEIAIRQAMSGNI